VKRVALRLIADQRVRFLLTGATNTVVGYLFFASIQFTVGRYITYDGSLILAQLLSSAIAFVLYRRFVFRVDGNLFIDYLRFQTVYIIPILINLFVLPVLVEGLRWNVYIAQAVITIVSAVISYIGHRYFSFRRKKPLSGNEPEFDSVSEAQRSKMSSELSPTDRPGVLTWARTSVIALYLASFLLTAIVTIGALRLWRADWSIPFRYDSDAVGGDAQMKTTMMTGWYDHQSLLGAPGGQFFNDYYTADNLGPLFGSVARWFTQDWALVINVYYVLGFLLAALAAVWFFRLLGVSRILTIVLSALFAIAPYHFYRGENHLWLSAYFPLPLVLGLIYLILTGRPIWGVRPDTPRWRAWITWRSASVVITIAVLATDSTYYGFFAVILIAFAGVVAWFVSRDWKRLLGAAVAGVLVVMVLLINMLPNVLYSWANGTNDLAVIRPPGSTEGYSLKLAQLILPVPGDLIPGLARLRAFYDATNPVPNEDPSLGLIGAAGLLALLALTFYFIVRRSHNSLEPASVSYRLRALSGLTIFALLLSTVGGFASFLGLLTNSLRGWNRMSIIIALFALAAVGIVLDYLFRRLAARIAMKVVARRVLVSVVMVFMLGVGFVDQTASSVPAYAQVKSEYISDGNLVAAIERVSGKHAMVLQLPYRDYPESATSTGVPDTEQLKFFLHSNTLSWSGGGIKGRPDAEWSGIAEEYGLKPMLQGAAAAGFAGVLVDRVAEGPSAGKVVASIASYLGGEAAETPDHRYEYFTLSTARAHLAARVSSATIGAIGRDIVHPVLATIQPNVLLNLTAVDIYKRYTPEILVQNPRSTPVRVKLTMPITYGLGTATMQFSYRYGDKTVHHQSVGPNTRNVTFTIDAAPGRSYVDLSVVKGTALPAHVPIVPVLTVGTIITQDLKLETLLGVSAK
jgi:phosphoglycerol transferase